MNWSFKKGAKLVILEEENKRLRDMLEEDRADINQLRELLRLNAIDAEKREAKNKRLITKLEEIKCIIDSTI